MARIIVAQFITLDGVVEDPDGSGGTPFGGWCLRHGREAIAGDKFHYGPILQTGIFLFGRRTWEAFAALWPPRDATDPFARALNAADKAVVTGGDIDLERWQNSRRVTSDPVGWAQRVAVDRDVVVIGSGSVVEAFVRAGAVDEYRLRVFPTAAGAGRRLFPDGAALDLERVEQVGPTSLVIATPSG